METFLASIMLWPVNFAPNGWQYCAGQTLAISQYSALFALLGTTYGGNGTTTFQLPDFRGRIPVGAGQGPGLSTYVIGQKSGNESVSILTNNLPSHVHPVTSLTVTISASNAQATANVPVAGTSTIAAPNDPLSGDSINAFNNSAPNVALTTASGSTGPTGGNLPVSVIQPYLAVNYIIALVGIFPSRN